MPLYPGLPADFTSISAPAVVDTPVEDDGEPLRDLRQVSPRPTARAGRLT